MVNDKQSNDKITDPVYRDDWLLKKILILFLR